MWLLWVNSVAVWVTGGAVVLFMTYLLASRLVKQRRHDIKKRYDVTQKEIIAGIVAEALPVHPNSGWVLEGGHDGLRIFSRYLNSLHHYSSTQIFAASLIVDVSAKRALALVTSLRELPSWFFGLPYSACSPPSLVGPASTNSHMLQFTMRNKPHGLLRSTLWAIRLKLANWAVKYAPVLERFVSAPQKIKTENLERCWSSCTDELSYVFSEPRVPSSLPYSWCSIYFTSLRQPGVCLVTMVMCPSQQGASSVPSLITGHLCALREHVTMRSFKGYSRHYPSNKPISHSSTVGSGKVKRSEKVKKSGVLDAANGGRIESMSSSHLELDTEGGNDSSDCQPPSVASLPEEGPEDDSAGSAPSSVSTHPDPGRPVAMHPDHARSVIPTDPRPSPPTSPEAILNAKYLTLAQEYTNKLVVMAEEGTQDGWLDLGTNKNVHRMKKSPDGSGPAINSVKGYGTVKAPPEFVLRFLEDADHMATLDDMLHHARVIEKVSDAVTLAQLLYKGVWPTSPRDLSVLSIAGQVNATTWVSSGTSVTDPRIPQEKGYVRAELLGGGYVIQSMADQPEWSGVTYVACIDLKGNIPSFAVNKIAESQPMCVNNLRTLVEPLYQQMKNDPQKMAALQEKQPIHLVCAIEEAAAEPLVSDGTLEGRLAQSEWHYDPTPGQVQQNGLDNGSEGHSGFRTPTIDSDNEDVGDRIGGNHKDGSKHTGPPESPSLSSPTPASPTPISSTSPQPDSDSVFQIGQSDPGLQQHHHHASNGVERTQSVSSAALRLSPYTPNTSHQPDSHLQSITKENIYYPRSDSGQVDYRTMANQTAARVLEEVFHVSGLDLLDSSTFTIQPTGGWSFAGLEKDVLLLTKSSADCPFTSFMGKGIIPLTPDYVFNSLRNPQLRFMYDNMLKELHIVKHIEEGLFILHLHHETTQCFIKQARDFCILVSERCEPKKKLLTGISVETTDCPPDPSLHRGKVHCSGWVVEPKHVKGKLCSEITYLLQVDVGGVPSTLVNFISKRQPLAVAYLREYLVSTSLEQSLKIDQ